MAKEIQSLELDRRGFLLRTAAVAAGTLGLETAARSGAVLAISTSTPQEEAEAFLTSYVRGWLPLETAANEASWIASTDVSEAHTAAQVTANQKVNEFVGSPEVISKVKQLLRKAKSPVKSLL
jgi:peptidyl-dipeptidase A